jgi:hypothetical protein
MQVTKDQFDKLLGAMGSIADRITAIENRAVNTGGKKGKAENTPKGAIVGVQFSPVTLKDGSKLIQVTIHHVGGAITRPSKPFKSETLVALAECIGKFGADKFVVAVLAEESLGVVPKE